MLSSVGGTVGATAAAVGSEEEDDEPICFEEGVAISAVLHSGFAEEEEERQKRMSELDQEAYTAEQLINTAK